MLAKGKYDLDEISEITGIPVADVKRLAKSKKPKNIKRYSSLLYR